MNARSMLRASSGLVPALLLAPPPTLAAQETGRIQGAVIDQTTQRPLSGAQVIVQRAGVGTLTGSDGRYLLLNVPAGTHRLRVRLIGYATREQTVSLVPGDTATADFQLAATPLALEEIVVTGTAAEARRREIGNSIEAIGAGEIETINLRSTEEVLAGRAPGVTVMTNNGQPGSGGTVKIRGLTTVSQTLEPLIYVDGIRVYNLPTRTGWDSRTAYNPLQDIAPGDIERMEVIKGASATTLYGTEAAGGVIQIFTKKGVSGSPTWTGEVGVGVNDQASFLSNTSGHPTDLYTRCDDLENLYTLNVLDSVTSPNFGERVYLYDPTCPSDGDWQTRGVAQKYTLSVRGGVGDVTYYLSGNYNSTEGAVPTSRNRDGGFRANVQFAPLDNLTVSLNTAYTRRNTRWVPDGNNADGFLLNVGRGSQNYLKGGKGDDCANVPAAPGGGSRVCVTNGYLFDQNLTSALDHFLSGLTLNWNPVAGLSNRLVVGWDYTEIGAESWLPFGYLRTPEGLFWDEGTRHTKLSLDYAGSFQNRLSEKLASTLSWGGQIFADRHRWTEVDVEKFAGPGRPTIETGAELTYRDELSVKQSSAGFFLQEMLGWQDRIFLTAGLRVDGNSAFGENFGLQTYPKASLSYIVSDYDFWPSDWFETFKLRGALGYSGKAPGPFDKVRTWEPVGIEGEPGFTPEDVGNPDVGPEQTREIEVGFDASLFTGRVGIEATYYDARTTDALVPRTLVPSEGFPGDVLVNVGELKNTGYEFHITGVPLRTRQFAWRLHTNLTFMESEAIDLAGEEIFADDKAEFREGMPIPVLVGDRVRNPNEFADPSIARDTVLGPVFPTRLIGLGTTFNVGDRLSIDAMFEHQGGHYVANWTGYQNARRGAWHPCFAVQEKIIAAYRGDAGALNDVRALDRARCGINRDVGYDHDSDFWVERGDFWKLRSIMLTYRLPDSWMRRWGGRNASVSLSARNLFTWTDYSGTDPEVMDFGDLAEEVYDGAGDYGRRDYYQIPNTRTYTLSFRIGW